MFWSVCRKVVCFAVILRRKKVSFQFAASPPNFSLFHKLEVPSFMSPEAAI